MKYIVELAGERHEVELGPDGVRYDGSLVHTHLADIAGTPVRQVTIGTEVHRVLARRGASRGVYSLVLDGHRYDVEALDERTRAIRDLAGATAGAVGPTPLVAPMPGLIVRITVSVGDSVAAGQGLVMMEAMKMENELRSASAGTVAAIRVQPGQAVEKGAVLVELMA
jgi:biotin carboxyl carrier protein